MRRGAQRTGTILAGVVICMATSNCAGDHRLAERIRMVERQIAARGITDERVLQAMRTVPRHVFVPDELQDRAYDDTPLPIGSGQTISQPYIVALMTELARVTTGARVLEIGTGSGYQAAVLAHLAREVYSIEIIPELADRARRTLQKAGIRNVTVKAGDGYLGWKDHAPYDAVLVTAAPPQVPSPLLDQLAPGGRLVVPEGDANQMLRVYEKNRSGRITKTDSIPVIFVPMTGIAAGGVMKLPTPDTQGGLAVEQALLRRTSRRSYADRPVTPATLGQVLWAAGGGRPALDGTAAATRNYPSAGGVYPLRFYAVVRAVDGIPAGLYEYDAPRHALLPIRSGDVMNELHRACRGQGMFVHAAAAVVITGDEKRVVERYGERGRTRYLYLDAGHAGQNIYLQCEALGIGTVAVGAFDDDALARLVGSREVPIYVFPIGVLK